MDYMTKACKGRRYKAISQVEDEVNQDIDISTARYKLNTM